MFRYLCLLRPMPPMHRRINPGQWTLSKKNYVILSYRWDVFQVMFMSPAQWLPPKNFSKNSTESLLQWNSSLTIVFSKSCSSEVCIHLTLWIQTLRFGFLSCSPTGLFPVYSLLSQTRLGAGEANSNSAFFVSCCPLLFKSLLDFSFCSFSFFYPPLIFNKT